eukprot:CAMPEP_0197640594 /NCGR_PEP_ID=MMETSP1338-20131121/14834_1 /TAXON_ID=43686 ORGANISM="Pelagodinium beii, Strain RCC1491" /NCGR_SAMPLE_ID=MMETSP1338 /ASSEMBLY_ACC=CAM_ASM_000754 /LENGTH=68 /DNA_ID=CAMNT_0043213461 /DNA_START=178 /DNA_END=381 /DNA_ORIENTATION=+
MPKFFQLKEAIKERFGDKVVVMMNIEECLEELIGSPKWRPGAFEVSDVPSRELLETHMGSGIFVTERQ